MSSSVMTSLCSVSQPWYDLLYQNDENKQHATVVDIMQCAAIPVPPVIKPKIVQWRYERRVQAQIYINKTELGSELNLQSNYVSWTALSFEEQLENWLG